MAAIRSSRRTSGMLPTPSGRTPFVLGSRPSSLRSPPLRITPMQGQRNYGKQSQQVGNATGQPNPAGAGFGDTGMSGMS